MIVFSEINSEKIIHIYTHTIYKYGETPWNIKNSTQTRLLYFFQEIFHLYKGRECATCHTVPMDYAVCLQCGAYLCTGNLRCCVVTKKKKQTHFSLFYILFYVQGSAIIFFCLFIISDMVSMHGETIRCCAAFIIVVLFKFCFLLATLSLFLPIVSLYFIHFSLVFCIPFFVLCVRYHTFDLTIYCRMRLMALAKCLNTPFAVVLEAVRFYTLRFVVRLCVCVRVFVHVYACLCMYVRVFVHVCACLCMYMRVCACVYMCLFV